MAQSSWRKALGKDKSINYKHESTKIRNHKILFY
jgi:hypothetical protein